MSNHLLSPLIKSLTLLEISRYKKELGAKPISWQEELAALEQQNKTDGNLFVHFSDYPRMGLYLKNQYKTPIGFYAYFLDRNKMKEFATNRPYAIVIRPKPTARLLDFTTYSPENLQQDIEKLVTKGFSNRMIQYAKNAARKNEKNLSGSQIWNITRLLSRADSYEPNDLRAGGSTGKWSYLLWKMLGYDGVVDDGFEIIHHLEPNQAVFFNTTQVEIVRIVEKGGVSTPSQQKPLFTKRKLTDHRGKDFSGMNVETFLDAIGHEEEGYFLIEHADFSGASFRGVNFNRINFRDCLFVKTDFAGAEITSGLFQRCEFGAAKFTEANLKTSSFSNCKLNSANFYATNLRHVRLLHSSLKKAYLQDADFSGAVFSDVDFIGSNLEDAVGLWGVPFSNRTKFPVGFDPEERGMKLFGKL